MRPLMLLLASFTLAAWGGWGGVFDAPVSADQSAALPTQPQLPATDDPKPEQESSEPTQERATPQPVISITTAIEEGKKVVLATVTLDEKPIEGVQVAFFVERTFGLLPLGTEETLDDGTAAVPFPQGLPGGANGDLRIVAEIKSPAEYAAVRGRTTLGGGIVIAPKADPFPRAVWAPKAPLPLLVTIATLVGGVWCAYAYVFVQLMKIRKGA